LEYKWEERREGQEWEEGKRRLSSDRRGGWSARRAAQLGGLEIWSSTKTLPIRSSSIARSSKVVSSQTGDVTTPGAQRSVVEIRKFRHLKKRDDRNGHRRDSDRGKQKRADTENP